MREELEKAAAALDAATLGRRLKEARIAARLTQPELGGDDASAAYLSRVERGQRRPSPALLERLCARLGVEVEQIVLSAPVPDARQIACEVNFAELDLISGSPREALDRVERIAAGDYGDSTPELDQRCWLVRGGAQAALGDVVGAIATFEGILEQEPTLTTWASASLRLSRLLREAGDLSRSISVGETAIAALRSNAAAPVDDIVRLVVTVAAAYWERGDVVRALTMCRQAIAESEATGSPAARGAAYWNTAIIESQAGNLDEALTLTRRALGLFEAESDLRLYARLRTQLGELLLRVDPPGTDEALVHLSSAQQALAFTSADIVEVLHNRLALARAHYAAGDLTRSTAEANSCLEDGADHPFVAAEAASLLGRIAIDGDRVDEARRRFREAIAHLSMAGSDRRVAQQWFTLAAVLDEVGLDDEAKDAYRSAAASTGLSTASLNQRSRS